MPLEQSKQRLSTVKMIGDAIALRNGDYKCNDVKGIIKNLLDACPTLNEKVCRPQKQAFNFFNWLESMTDFFTAPASTRYHLSEVGGLAKHSLNVYYRLAEYKKHYEINIPDESIIIVGILHDICKTNYYEWKHDHYLVNDTLPLNHGHKSVIVIQNVGVRLTRDEMLAIAHHMGAYHAQGIYEFERTMNKAIRSSDLVLPLQFADHQGVVEDNL